MDSCLNVRVFAENLAHHCPVGNISLIENAIFGEFPATSYQGVEQNGCMPSVEQRRSDRTADIACSTRNQHFHPNSLIQFMLIGVSHRL